MVELVPTPLPPPPPPPGSSLPTAPEFEDLVEVTSSGPGLSIESLVAPTPVLSADWYKAPSRFGSRLAAQMVSSRTIPVDIRSLGRGRWVSDAVMDVTCTLLAPHLAPGLRLIPSYMLHSLLSGGDLAVRRWAPSPLSTSHSHASCAREPLVFAPLHSRHPHSGCDQLVGDLTGKMAW